MKSQTRKEFCKTCFLLTLSGFALPVAAAGQGAAAAQQKDATEKEGTKMKKIIAYCGLTCSECPAYIATQKNDDKLRAETAKKWSAQFNSAIKPEDINCDGCPSASERLFNYCRICEIRKCAQGKKIENCAYCAEFPCKKLADFLAMAPEAKKTLEEIRKAKK